MTLNGWLQIILILATVVAFAIPLGAYMGRVFAGERTVLSPVLGPLERGFYKVSGIDPAREQGWLGYTLAMLAFNVAVSFVTNTNRLSYGGETTMSLLSQMAGLAVRNVLSAATGIALAVALVRAFARSGAPTVGNFFADMTRATPYVLLPLAIRTGLFRNLRQVITHRTLLRKVRG